LGISRSLFCRCLLVACFTLSAAFCWSELSIRRSRRWCGGGSLACGGYRRRRSHFLCSRCFSLSVPLAAFSTRFTVSSESGAFTLHLLFLHLAIHLFRHPGFDDLPLFGLHLAPAAVAFHSGNLPLHGRWANLFVDDVLVHENRRDHD
jgi:hypothetical protein